MLWKLLRIVVSCCMLFELVAGSAFGGGRVAVEMPQPEVGECAGYVNAFTGTGGYPWMCGMCSPAAAAPFGCVRLGPDTSAVFGLALLKTNTSGYYYEHRHIRGFSFGRLSGTGARDYGMFRVTPAAVGKKAEAPALAFSHSGETASPGYYAVYLPEAGALCEMTATAHAGLQRYTFSGRNARLVLDAASQISDSAKDAFVSVDPGNNCLTARATLDGAFSGRYGGLTVYCYMEWDAPVVSVSARTAEGDFPGRTEAAGETAAVSLSFGDIKGRPLTLRAGVSFLSAEQARENLAAETAGQGFDAVRAATAAAWEDRLSAVRLDASAAICEVFYTSLYHAMLMPTDFTEANGEYLGFDGQAHAAEGFTYRTDLSLWDTARNAHALYTLLAPDVQRDSLCSLLAMAEQGGVLPRWPMGAGYTGSMFGNPANLVFTESYLKGVAFDAEAALEAMKTASDGTHPGKDERDSAALYNEYGYLPDDLVARYSVSKTLEYAWEDAAIADLAAALGRAEDAAYYAARSMNYKNLWDPDTRYFRPKNSDGSWGSLRPNMTSFFDDIFGTDLFRAYCEGSARQWRFSAQHDTAGLIELFGGAEAFVKELNAFMEDASPRRAWIDPGAGFWLGNQHDIHTPYLFNDAGRADLTQKWVRWALDTRYDAEPDGLDGNDDGGTLGAWYVFSALGFYPIAGTDRYWIGSPNVNGAALRLENGNVLTVTVRNQSKENVFVGSVTLNGEPLGAPYLTHAQLAAGGELAFTMQPEA